MPISDGASGGRRTVVDLNWPPDKLKEFCQKNDNWILQLDVGMTSADVEALYRRQLTIPAPYEGVIAEIAGDERTPRWALEDVLVRFLGSVEVMASLATNGAVSEDVLRRLLVHDHPTVREHAEHSLQRRRQGA